MTSKLALGVLLAGNLILGVFVWGKLRSARMASPSQPSVSHSSNGAMAKSARLSQRKGPTQVVQVETAPDRLDWSRIQSAELKKYVANLRQVECPEETLRDIIVAEVNRLFIDRQKKLRAGQTDEYWKTENWNSKENRERQKKYRELEKEKSALLTELLGVDPIKQMQAENGYQDYYERMYSFLPADKQEKARKVQERYQEMLQEIWTKGMMEEDDQRQVQRIYRQQAEEMAQFMTPGELEEYQLRSSQVANQLRHDLDGFEPTADEFRTVYKLRQAREEDLIYPSDPDDKAGQERRNQAQKEVDAQIKEALGEQRFAEYKRAQDYEYKQLLRLVERQGLTKETAVTVFDMRKTLEEQAQKIRSDKTLTPDKRNEALMSMRTEAEQTLGQTLGDKGFKSYQRRNGWWLNNIYQAPRKTTP